VVNIFPQNSHSSEENKKLNPLVGTSNYELQAKLHESKKTTSYYTDVVGSILSTP
jgi:hypothetical protein